MKASMLGETTSVTAAIRRSYTVRLSGDMYKKIMLSTSQLVKTHPIEHQLTDRHIAATPAQSWVPSSTSEAEASTGS